MQDSWKERTCPTSPLGSLFPFVGREKAVDQLMNHVQLLFNWYNAALTSQKSWGQLHKEQGFGFLVAGAASGIGKTVFARRGRQHKAINKNLYI